MEFYKLNKLDLQKEAFLFRVANSEWLWQKKRRMKLYLKKVELDALNVSPSSVYFQTLFWQTIMKYLTNIPHQQLKCRRCER